MNAVLFGMAAAIIALVLLLAYVVDQVIRLQADVTDTDKADHAMCIAHIADVTSKRMVAVALRNLAKRYDSVQGERELHGLRQKYGSSRSDMATIPALWLLERADELDPS